MNRWTLIGAAAAVAAFPVLDRVASAQTSLKTKNVVFVRGLFADGSCWSKGHRPRPAEGHQLHQCAEPSDLAA